MNAPRNAASGSQPGQNEQTAQAVESHGARVETNLSYRYGSIGIEAVAAAVRYAGVRKNPAYAPTVSRIEPRRYENAV